MTTLELEQWQLDQHAAEAYERYLVPLFFAPGAGVLLDLAGLNSSERVLDVACGTGIVARRAAQRMGEHGSVVGLDLSAGMLDVARELSEDIQPAIEWEQGDATALPYADASFDVVFCQQGLQFFPDAPRALSEMHRVLVPDGRLAASVLRSVHHNPGYIHLANVLEQHLGPEAGEMMRSPFSSLSTDELRILLTNAGFHQVKIIHGIAPVRYLSVEEFLQQELASSPLASQFASMTNGVEDAMIQDLAEAMSDYIDDDGVVFPAETYLAVARR